jgi:hypothetical protein
VAPTRFLALSTEDSDFRRLNMTERHEKQAELIFNQAQEKGDGINKR